MDNDLKKKFKTERFKRESKGKDFESIFENFVYGLYGFSLMQELI